MHCKSNELNKLFFWHIGELLYSTVYIQYILNSKVCCRFRNWDQSYRWYFWIFWVVEWVLTFKYLMYSTHRAGNSLIGFQSKSLIFCPKMSEWGIRSKNELFTHSLIFGERPERFAPIAHLIWAKSAIHSYRSSKKRKWAKMGDLLIFSINSFLNRI